MLIPNLKAVSDLTAQVLAGKLPLEEVPEFIRPSVHHLTLLPVYRMACDILNAGSQAERRYRLDQIPETLRQQVKTEAERVFELRKYRG